MSNKVKFTAGRIESFQCDPGKSQAFLWDSGQPGLLLRATGNGAKSYAFETRLNGKTLRITIGDTQTWSIGSARAEAARLKSLTDQGIDPRQLLAEKVAADKAKAAALKQQQIVESVTVAEAWADYVAERSAAVRDGKPEWGEAHKQHHEMFVQPGGVKRKAGQRPGQPDTTRPGILLPLMSLRLVDLTSEAIAAWLEKEVPRVPTYAGQAFRALRAFMNWCAQSDKYAAATQKDACTVDAVKRLVPKPKAKKNDTLRRAQLHPWFEAVQRIPNPVIAAYLQCLLLTGARRNELAGLRWADVDFRWKSMVIRDKVEGERTIPLTPYVEHLIAALPRRNEYVFSSPTSESGRLKEPRMQHATALSAAALPPLTQHGLRRSFSTLSEWVEVPAGIVAQIMGHKPSAIAEKHYIRRELDLLYKWHVKIESWILEQAGVTFDQAKPALQVVVNNA